MSKVWMITGSSRGLGLQIARTMLAAGETVVATARKAEAVTAALGEHERLLALPLDVTDRASIAAAVSKVLERFGRVDVLVNNAGYGVFGPFEEASVEEIEQQFRVNLFGTMYMTHAVIPHMREKRSGRIFNITSVAGISGFGMSSLYCSSKFAMEGWSESMTMELAPLGIQVTAIEPGFFRTEFLGEDSVHYIEARHEEYREGVAGLRTWLDAKHQQQEGDPAKLAEVLLEMTKKEQQPVRLLMGSDAVVMMNDRVERDRQATAEWESVSKSTDFPA